MSAPSPPPSPSRRPLPQQPPQPLRSSVASFASNSAPPPPPPRRGSRALQPRHGNLNEGHRADTSKLQIRVVPYSPPRLSSDGGSLSSSSRPVSYADSDAAIAASVAASASPSPSPTVRRASGRHGDEVGPSSPDVSDLNIVVHAQSPHPQLVLDQSQSNSGLSSPSEPSNPFLSAPATARRLHPRLPGTGGMSTGPDTGMTPGNDPGVPVNASTADVISPISAPDRPSSATSSIGSRSSNRSRRNRVINLHANNKTFSLAPLSGSLSSRTDSFATGPPSLATPSSSYGRVSSASALYNDDRPISPLTSVGEQPGSPASTLTSIPDITTASPWNYRLVGGLRKVKGAPVDEPEPEPESEPGPSRIASNFTSNYSSQESLPALPPLAITKSSSDRLASASLVPKASFSSSQSSQSGSTVSERTNYKVYGQSSPAHASSHSPVDLDTLPPSSSHSVENYHIIAQSSPPATFRPRTADDLETLPPSSSHSNVNFRVIGQSSPVVAVRYRTADRNTLPPSSSHSNANYQVLGESSSSNNSLYELQRPQTGDSDANYVVHHPGASTSSLVTTRSRLRPEYSQESLIVPPLRPGRQTSIESLRLAAKRSRDSLRSGSFTSLSSIITQEAARALFAGPSAIYIPASIRKENNSRGKPARLGSHSGSSMIQSHPHQWSSQLSTVPSESEPSSRALSPISEAARRSSFFSQRSTRMRSISSSLAGPFENLSRSGSHSIPESIDRPQAAHMRHSSREESLSPRLIRDHDEDGDGLADLEDLRHKHSRTRLSSILSHQTSDRNLRSSGSSRSNSLTSSLPAWARVYYGSGERRFVVTHPSTESMYSLYNETPRSGSRSGSLLRHSPSAERFMMPIRNGRRRPREQQHQSVDEAIHRDPTQEPEDEIQEEEGHPVLQVARRIRKQTSSIWSPHLAYDRRATRYSMWEPPSTTWSEEAGIISRRNVQVILFIIGFVFPIAWMIAAFLPLPSMPRPEMAEQLASTSNVDLQQQQQPQYMQAIDQIRYNSARWWRNLNRIMSVVGLLIIGAIIALAILGVKRRW